MRTIVGGWLAFAQWGSANVKFRQIDRPFARNVAKGRSWHPATFGRPQSNGGNQSDAVIGRGCIWPEKDPPAQLQRDGCFRPRL
jgi:hypothetical protein